MDHAIAGHVPYDWANPDGLTDHLGAMRAAPYLVVGSTEGGLLDYASDEQVAENLRAFRTGAGGENLLSREMVLV